MPNQSLPRSAEGQSPVPAELFSLRNFEADLSTLDELQLEKAHHAQAMAICLAEMHWNVKIDAADVEFVLGSAPEQLTLKPAQLDILPPRTDSESSLNFRKRTVHLWLLDFNQCKQISMDDAGVNQAVTAFWQNDPHYPRPCPPGHPDEDLWRIFKDCYLKHSSRKVNSKSQGKDLARQFIDGVVAEAIKRASTTAGPPRSQPLRNGPIRRRGSLRSICIGSPPLDGTTLEGPRGGVFTEREPPRGGFSRGGGFLSRRTSPRSVPSGRTFS